MAAAEHQQELLDTFQCYGAVLEKSAALLKIQDEQSQKVATLIPKAVEALLANERIEPQQKEACAGVLKDPVRCLEILIKTAYHRNHAENSKIGQSVDPTTKNASANTKKAALTSTTSPYVGEKTGRRKESDLALLSRLGIDPQG